MRVSCHHDQVFKFYHHYRKYLNELRQDQSHIQIKNIENDQGRSSISRLRQFLSTLYLQVF